MPWAMTSSRPAARAKSLSIWIGLKSSEAAAVTREHLPRHRPESGAPAASRRPRHPGRGYGSLRQPVNIGATRLHQQTADRVRGVLLDDREFEMSLSAVVEVRDPRADGQPVTGPDRLQQIIALLAVQQIALVAADMFEDRWLAAAAAYHVGLGINIGEEARRRRAICHGCHPQRLGKEGHRACVHRHRDVGQRQAPRRPVEKAGSACFATRPVGGTQFALQDLAIRIARDFGTQFDPRLPFVGDRDARWSTRGALRRRGPCHRAQRRSRAASRPISRSGRQ